MNVRRGRIGYALSSPWALLLCLLCWPAAARAQAAQDGNAPPGLLTLKNEMKLESRHLPRWEDDGGPDAHEAGSSFRRLRFVMVYSVKVKNTGEKQIEGVVWDYVFVRLRDEKELARIRFGTKARVKPGGGGATLKGTTRRPPAFPRVVSVEELEKEGDRKYRQQVEVKCVLYADGTWWRQPGVTQEGCVKLESAKPFSGW